MLALHTPAGGTLDKRLAARTTVLEVGVRPDGGGSYVARSVSRDLRDRRFTRRVASADELWDGVVGGTVRTAALVNGQPEHMRHRIRAAFDRHASRYETADALQLPVRVKSRQGADRS